MRNLMILTSLLLAIVQAPCRTSSTPESNESQICFTEKEWAAMEEEVKKIVEETAREAVKAAEAPFKETIQIQSAKIAELKTQNETTGAWATVLGILSAVLAVGCGIGWGLVILR